MAFPRSTLISLSCHINHTLYIYGLKILDIAKLHLNSQNTVRCSRWTGADHDRFTQLERTALGVDRVAERDGSEHQAALRAVLLADKQSGRHEW